VHDEFLEDELAVRIDEVHDECTSGHVDWRRRRLGRDEKEDAEHAPIKACPHRGG